MKCLSLWQPWATLVAIGAKQCETRSWSTSHRGVIAIHASRRWTPELKRLVREWPFQEALAEVFGMPARWGDVLPFGAIVAFAQLADVKLINANTTPLNEREFKFGDYTPGRYRWDLVDVVRLNTPIPCKGHQGLFEIPDDWHRTAMRLERGAA